jgi:hypothetical protein
MDAARGKRAVERWRQGWGRTLGVGLFGVLLLARTVAAWAEPVPSPEQLLTATLHADDLQKQNLDPGGWWNDAPEFNGRLEPDSRPEMLTYVMSHLFGKPDDNPAEVATGLHLYATAAASADDFTASTAADKQDYGGIVDGPKIGDQSRYLRQAADNEHEAGAALHFQIGRYRVRIDVGGKAGGISANQLAALGKVVLGRLAELDAGKLAEPPLPEVAKFLPAASDQFKPVLGPAVMESEAWAWVWSNGNSALGMSPRLRAMLHDHVTPSGPVIRRYGLAANPGNVAELTLMPFSDADAAAQYITEAKREDPRRGAIVTSDGDIIVSPPIPDVSPAYRVERRVGRYVADIACFAPFAPTSSACAAAAKQLAEEAIKAIPEK